MVLGNRDKAKTAFTKAIQELAKEPKDVEALKSLAAGLGLSTQ